MPAAERVDVGAALADVAERLQRVTVQVRADGRSAGSGIVWRREGVIVTNAHVVQGDAADVQLADGRVLGAVLTHRDERRDVAVLAVSARDLPVAERSDARALRAGEMVVAFGHPLGVANALTLGVVHRAPDGERGASRWVVADIRLAPGNSGGPLADASGRVVGLNAMIVGGLGYAVPVHAVERVLAGGGATPAVGAKLWPVTLRSRRDGDTRLGWVILETVDGGAAAGAGLIAGDVLLSVDGQPLDGPDAVAEQLDLAQPGDRWRIEVLRGHTMFTREVTLGHRGGRRAEPVRGAA